MYITMTEFRKYLDKYIELSRKKKIIITKYGKPYVKLECLLGSKKDLVYSLAGSLPSDIDIKSILDKKYSNI